MGKAYSPPTTDRETKKVEPCWSWWAVMSLERMTENFAPTANKRYEQFGSSPEKNHQQNKPKNMFYVILVRTIQHPRARGKKDPKNGAFFFLGKLEKTNPRLWLVGGWTNPFEKHAMVKMDHLPNFWGENKKYLSCHHLVMNTGWLMMRFPERIDFIISIILRYCTKLDPIKHHLQAVGPPHQTFPLAPGHARS